MRMHRKLMLLFVSALGVVILAAVVLLPLVRGRDRSAVAACFVNLRQIDGAKQQWAVEYKKTTNDVPTWDDVRPYFGSGPKGLKHEIPVCPQGGTYTLGRADELPKCSVGGPSHTLTR